MERDIDPYSYGWLTADKLKEAVLANPSLIHLRSLVSGQTLLAHAVERGSESWVRFLLEHGSPLVDEPGSISPLMESCHRGAVSFTKALLDHGANVNGQDDEGRTPLHWALIGGRVEVVEFLLAMRADFRQRSNDGFTPLMLAACRSNQAAVNLLRNATAPLRVPSKPTRFATIHEAAEHGDLADVAQHLSNRVDINEVRELGWTPLFLASLDGHWRVVKYLLENGAMPSVVDVSGTSPPEYAELAERDRVIRLYKSYFGGTWEP
jgi:ankyrin repeat protein